MFSSLWPHLNERDRRLVAAACARAMGRGGVSTVSRSAGLSRPTIIKAVSELDEEPLPSRRARREGAGRRTATEADPRLETALDALVDPDSRGDPGSPLRWTVKSTRQLASALSGAGHPASPSTVRALLHRLGYSLQSSSKVLEGAQHPDRNAQFGYINGKHSRPRFDDELQAQRRAAYMA
jgi:transposase